MKTGYGIGLFSSTIDFRVMYKVPETSVKTMAEINKDTIMQNSIIISLKTCNMSCNEQIIFSWCCEIICCNCSH